MIPVASTLNPVAAWRSRIGMPSLYVTALSRRFGVSSRTAHRWIDRFEREGLDGLADCHRHCAPKNSPRKTARVIEEIITADEEASQAAYARSRDFGGFGPCPDPVAQLVARAEPPYLKLSSG